MATIAVVDDDQDNREMLQALMEGHGYSVQQFGSGEDFLGMFKPGAFRLIFVDLSMPDMDGYELLEGIRRQDQAVPVMAVTAAAYQTDRDKARAAGFADFITKPFTDMPAFLDIVKKHLE